MIDSYIDHALNNLYPVFRDDGTPMNIVAAVLGVRKTHSP